MGYRFIIFSKIGPEVQATLHAKFATTHNIFEIESRIFPPSENSHVYIKALLTLTFFCQIKTEWMDEITDRWRDGKNIIVVGHHCKDMQTKLALFYLGIY